MTAAGGWWGVLVAAATLATLGSAHLDGQEPAAAGPQAAGTHVAAPHVDFGTQVRPLLSDRCFRCHGPDAAKRKAKLRLDTREGAFKDLDDGWAVVAPFEPERSELVRRIFTDDDDDRMPPSDSHLSLSEAERQMLRTWVAQGAEYRAHWSLEPVHAVPVPTLGAEASRAAVPGTEVASINPIDAFVRARLAREGMAPALRASSELVIRRVAFNLTGLPPTLAEIDAFVADPSPDAYASAVDRYLSSPAYGERMALDWLDLARYADTYGYQADIERDMSPYRDWVIRAFNDNLSYDQFLIWQLAGDLLPNATPDQHVATAFNRLHRQTNEGGSIEAEFRTEYVIDRVNTFGTAMLGLTVECARCHDHKFDPITHRDYYSLFAFFNSIDESGLYSHFTNATPSPSMLLWPAHHQRQQHDTITARIAALDAKLADIAATARPAFDAWRRTTRRSAGRLVAPVPIAHLPFDEVHGEATPDVVLTSGARLQDGPRLVIEQPGDTPATPRTGRQTGALQFSGDNSVVHPGVRTFVRTDPLTLSIRLKPTALQDRAILVHQSRAWTDAGSRGFELTLEQGRPFFGLIHFWPGNAVAVRARAPLPVGEWSRVTVTYDGSSRAAGIRIYVDGRAVATDVVRDHLYKDIDYRPAAGDQTTPTPPLMIGARFRDSGFKNGLIDDLQVFDAALTAVEVSGAPARETSDADLYAHFLARHHQPYRETLDALHQLRVAENRLVADIPEIMVMEELPEPRVAYILTRGSYDAPGERVTRDTPQSLPPFPVDQPRNRLGLAYWLTAPGHPLTARVVVNRIWRLHFGRGIVATQEDFGSQGSRPTHPELLDWLADWFVQGGWDVKALHRLIVSSQTFQQTSNTSTGSESRDPGNLLLSRGPKGRLHAEFVRDSALAASGLLDPTVGGPSVKPYQPTGLWEQSGTGKKYVQDTGAGLYRRSLYTFWRRTSPPPSMTTFDALSREVCTARRDVTATPLQSLVLLNDPQFVEAARALAARLMRRFPDDPNARNRDAFRALTGRAPDTTETAILARTFAEQRALFAARPDQAARLLQVGDSAADPQVPPVDLAAMTAVASLIMNFDEFIVVR